MKQAVWFPTEEYKEKTRLYSWMKSLGYEDYETFYNKSIENNLALGRGRKKQLAING
ncbi:hypothetical protein ACT7DZ_06795 [Bacillus cereus]